MGLVGFGQPDDGVIQMAYVVADIRASINHWVTQLNVGPWFLLDHFTGTDPKYRGRDSTADVSLAMSFAGHMNIELIQPNNDAPSVYREWIERRGYGFHHWGRAALHRHDAGGQKDLCFRARFVGLRRLRRRLRVAALPVLRFPAGRTRQAV